MHSSFALYSRSAYEYNNGSRCVIFCGFTTRPSFLSPWGGGEGGKASCRILGSTYPFITLNNHSSGDLSCKV